MTPLEVERSRSDGYELLTVEGELDIATASRMIAALNEVLADMEVPLVVDLSNVVFMDSTGLALLMNARRRAMRNGQGFAIVCPGGPISRVFEIADMVERLRVRPDRDSARLAATSRLGLDPDRLPADTSGVWKLRLPPPGRSRSLD